MSSCTNWTHLGIYALLAALGCNGGSGNGGGSDSPTDTDTDTDTDADSDADTDADSDADADTDSDTDSDIASLEHQFAVANGRDEPVLCVGDDGSLACVTEDRAPGAGNTSGARVVAASDVGVMVAGGWDGAPYCVYWEPGTPWTECAATPELIEVLAWGGGSWVAGTFGGDVQISGDDGATWAAPSDVISARDIAFGDGMFATEGGMASTDGGDTWAALTQAGPGFPLPTFIGYGDGLWFTNSGALYWSDDAGTTWTQAASFPFYAVNQIEDIAWGDGVFVAVSWDGTISRSTDGDTWTDVTPAAAAGEFAAVSYSVTYDAWLVTGGQSEIWHSTDGGLTWSAVPYDNTANPPFSLVPAVAAVP